MKQLGITQDAGKVSFGQLYGMCDQVSYLLGMKVELMNHGFMVLICAICLPAVLFKTSIST